MYQNTIKSEIKLSGVGLHTGIVSEIIIKPSDINTGITFIRTDITDQDNVIKAIATNVIETSRSTKIGLNQKVSVSTLEHLMASFLGCNIDNAIIEINGPEIPILDGSSKIFVDEILKVGIQEQNAKREYINIDNVISFKDEQTGGEIIAIPNDKFEIDIFVDFETETFKPQYAHLNGIDNFNKEIYDCRTFCFLHEIETLYDRGLIKGGSLDNAIVYVDKEIDEETKHNLFKHFLKKEIKVNNGILNNLELKYENEAARHKILDICGDIYLLGKRLNAKIIAKKTGHKINTELAKKILDYSKNKVTTYDTNKKPVKDINGIMKTLPHRYPFLLIDKIMELTDNEVVGIKNITFNESFFQGHFPDNPIMPGVLQIEAMAQVGGIYALKNTPDPENYSTYFLSIDKVKFKKKVIPGDTIVFALHLISPIRRGIIHMQGYAYVNGEVVSQAELKALVTKEKI